MAKFDIVKKFGIDLDKCFDKYNRQYSDFNSDPDVKKVLNNLCKIRKLMDYKQEYHIQFKNLFGFYMELNNCDINFYNLCMFDDIAYFIRVLVNDICRQKGVYFVKFSFSYEEIEEDKTKCIHDKSQYFTFLPHDSKVVSNFKKVYLGDYLSNEVKCKVEKISVQDFDTLLKIWNEEFKKENWKAYAGASNINYWIFNDKKAYSKFFDKSK